MAKQINRLIVDLLAEKIEYISQLEKKYDLESLERWHTETQLILEQIFGEESKKVDTLKRYDGQSAVFFSGESEDARQAREQVAYYSDLKGVRSFLQGILDFLKKIQTEPENKQVASIANTEQNLNTATHVLHPVIAEVATPLFNDGHYREAIRSALIEVIDRVKQTTGRRKTNNGNAELDGDDLMNHTFLKQKGERPFLYWGELRTDVERDFQTGMYYLFKGLVSLRNEKGHANVEQKDKEKTYEYLCFASLLMRQLDEAKRHKPPLPKIKGFEGL